MPIDAIDAPYPAYQDPDGYRRSATQASLLGFDGKWAIHPAQIAIAHDVFSPTEDEVADARLSIETYRRSEAEGGGAFEDGAAGERDVARGGLLGCWFAASASPPRNDATRVVIASEAKQSRGCKQDLDCFVGVASSQ